MKLAAQRNFSIELYDAGGDNMVLIGTMLDDAHLIKLEINVFLPDEQVTRSRLDMIRVPFPVCREVEAAAESLVGLRIERGVMTEIAQRIGGRAGCSHIKELACNIVYFAASHLVLKRTGFDPMTTEAENARPTRTANSTFLMVLFPARLSPPRLAPGESAAAITTAAASAAATRRDGECGDDQRNDVRNDPYFRG